MLAFEVGKEERVARSHGRVNNFGVETAEGISSLIVSFKNDNGEKTPPDLNEQSFKDLL